MMNFIQQPKNNKWDIKNLIKINILKILKLIKNKKNIPKNIQPSIVYLFIYYILVII